MKLLKVIKEIELKKGEWTPIPTEELEEMRYIIFDLISTAYQKIGNDKFRSTNDIVDSGKLDTDFTVVDIDGDGYIEAVSISKERPAGTKLTGLGHDGERASKVAIINYQSNLLKKDGYYVEASERALAALLKKGVKPIDDEELVRKVLKGKEIKWLGNGKYEREIAGKKYVKMMLGKPKKV